MAQGRHSKQAKAARGRWKIAVVVLGLATLCLVGALGYFLYTQPHSASTSSETTSTSQVEAGTESSADPNSASKAPNIKDSNLTEGAKKRGEEQAEQRAAEQERIDAEKAAEAEAKEAAKHYSEYVTSAAIVAAVPDNKEPTGFSLNEKRSVPSLSAEQADAIQAAAQSIEDAGYAYTALLIDLNSGQGIAVNAANPVYTASSFKAPFIDYLLENGLASEWEMSSIEAIILHSDNDTFEALASNHMDEAYQNWLTEHAIDYDDWSPWYPKASAKGMAACWADIYHYIQTDDSQAAWFKDLLANTNISFIRNALEGEDTQVWNKGGWLSDPEYNAVADCGIIEAGGRRYLMTILTDQPSWGETQERVQNLARALWDSRDVLT